MASANEPESHGVNNQIFGEFGQDENSGTFKTITEPSIQAQAPGMMQGGKYSSNNNSTVGANIFTPSASNIMQDLCVMQFRITPKKAAPAQAIDVENEAASSACDKEGMEQLSENRMSDINRVPVGLEASTIALTENSKGNIVGVQN